MIDAPSTRSSRRRVCRPTWTRNRLPEGAADVRRLPSHAGTGAALALHRARVGVDGDLVGSHARGSAVELQRDVCLRRPLVHRCRVQRTRAVPLRRGWPPSCGRGWRGRVQLLAGRADRLHTAPLGVGQHGNRGRGHGPVRGLRRGGARQGPAHTSPVRNAGRRGSRRRCRHRLVRRHRTIWGAYFPGFPWP